MPSTPPLRESRKVALGAVLLGFALAAGLFSPSGTAIAQVAVPIAVERLGTASPQARADLYRQLHTQAEFLHKQSAVLKTVAKLVGPTVVHIEADVPKAALPYGQVHQVEEAGSGAIVEIENNHYVLTNRHVIHGAAPAAIRIHLQDGRVLHPLRIWDDAETDVAVMSVAAAGLVASPVGDSDQMEIGDFVLAVGSPFGLSHSVTFGIISAKGRRDLELGNSGVKFQDFLQTDAAINPGNSGGPLINLQGEIVGINTAIASIHGGFEGVGFSTPINMFMVVAKQLIHSGKVTRAFLGVTLDATFGPAMAAEVGLPRPVGARVTDITPNSPATIAGLQRGDVILEFNGKLVEDDNHLVNLVNLTEIGKEVSLLVWRQHRAILVKTAVADRGRF
jgi:serine protease Do